MKKVLEVCLSPDLGGLELYMKNITKYLNSNAVINKKSKLKNVFENETFIATQISIKDTEDVAVPFNFIPNTNQIQIFPNTENLTGNTFIITLNNETTSTIEEITITHDVTAKEQECYTTYKIENVQVPNNTSELIDGIYVIKI